MATDLPPNQTVYVNNLNEKVKKEGALRGIRLLFRANLA